MLVFASAITAWWLRQAGEWGWAAVLTVLVTPLAALAREARASGPICVIATFAQAGIWLALWARRHSNDSSGLDVLALVMLAAGALPHLSHELLFHGERSRNATCDNVYVALNGEVANELDAALRGDVNRRCAGDDPAAIARCIVTEHVDEDNPLDKKQHAYTLGIPDACQVQLAPLSTNGITFAQRPHVGGATRTFSIRVD